jgi:hypothetical protein
VSAWGRVTLFVRTIVTCWRTLPKLYWRCDAFAPCRIASCRHFWDLTAQELFEEKTPWSESASDLYRPSDRRLSAKRLPTFADRRCLVVIVTDPYGRIIGFLDRNRYFFFQVAPQLYSRDWVDPVPDPLLLRTSDSAGNRTQNSGSVARNSHH